MERRKPREVTSSAAVTAMVARVREGQSDAWGELYREFAPAIFRFCRRALPAREDAEDATTEIFMKVKQKIGQYDSSRPFTAWLYKISANHCWDLLRRRHSGQEVREALERLPARARMVLILRYYSEMSYDEIAELLGIRRAFVGVLLLRARHRLRDSLVGRRADALAAAGKG